MNFLKGEIMKKVLVLLLIMSCIIFAEKDSFISAPDYVKVNQGSIFNLNGLPLHWFTKAGRDTDARTAKITGYAVSGKAAAAEKIYVYFLENISQQEDFQNSLAGLLELDKSGKEEILNNMSRNFTSKWQDKGVKVLISNTKDKKLFKKDARKNKFYYDDINETLYINEELFDFSDTDKITGAIGFACYDHLIFYNDEKWKDWDLSEESNYWESRKTVRKKK